MIGSEFLALDPTWFVPQFESQHRWQHRRPVFPRVPARPGRPFMRDAELHQFFMQATHSREKTIARSAGKEESGNRAGHNDCMFAASLGIERPRWRLRGPEAPLLIHESTDHTDTAEPAGIAPSYIQGQITAE